LPDENPFDFKQKHHMAIGFRDFKTLTSMKLRLKSNGYPWRIL